MIGMTDLSHTLDLGRFETLRNIANGGFRKAAPQHQLSQLRSS
jgi:hypothetical protein